MVPQEIEDPHTPSPNALPLMFVHGWDWKSIFLDRKGADPNDSVGRYYYVLLDIVNATNGVYRPVFVSHNSRASCVNIGNNLAGELHGKFLNKPNKIKGNPPPDDENGGNFPYIDTFGFSMGGLVTRSYQVYGGSADNMIIVGTPNHGTFGYIGYLEHLGLIPRKVLSAIGNISQSTAWLICTLKFHLLLLSTNSIVF